MNHTLVAMLLGLGAALAMPAQATVGESVDHAASATGHAVVKGAKAVEKGVEHAASGVHHAAVKTAQAVEKGAKKTGAAVERGAKKTGAAVERGAKKVGVSSSAPASASARHEGR
jgi:hypothetical protein